MTEDTKPRKTKAEREAEIHYEALEAFGRAYEAAYPVRRECRDDRLFCDKPGHQWAGSLGDQYKQKLKFEVNKTALGVQRIINEYRNNPVTVLFSPKDGTKGKIADVCAGLFRADEAASNAHEAKDNAFEEAVKGGFGAFRLRAEYEDEDDPDNEAQTVRIEPIFDADQSVFFDEDAKRQDKADAKRCWVLTGMSPARYEADYGHSPATWPNGLPETTFDWASPICVYVAEYYVLTERKARYSIYTGLAGETEKVTDAQAREEPELIDNLLARGFVLTATKKERTRQVRKYIMSGGRILEDCGIIAGSHIPIVPVYGRRAFVDGVEYVAGHVRNPRDAQRLVNMIRSKLGELSAQSSAEVPIFAPQQMTNPRVISMWENQAVENRPYLLAEPLKDGEQNIVTAGPIAYTKPPGIPPALAALAQMAEVDLQELLGNQQNAEELQPNTSSLSVELVQQRLDMQTFIYTSNFAKAMKRAAEIWLSMKKDTMVEPGRVTKIIAEDGSASSIEMMRPVVGKDGSEEMENDLSTASMDVVADVGPASSTRRNGIVKALSGLMAITRDPEAAEILQAAILQNIEGEGLSDINEYNRKKLVRKGVIQPTDEDKEWLQAEQQGKPADPNAEFLLASANKEKAAAGKAVADTKLAEARTAEILAGIDLDQRQHALGVAQAMSGAMQPAVSPGLSQSGVQ